MVFDSFIIYVCLIVIGLIFGSFFNVLADRLPKGETILGRSKCDSCMHVLQWFDLVPIISFSLLKAKCRYCKAPLSFQYPLSEIFTSIMFLLTYIFSTATYPLALYHNGLILYLSHFVIVSSLIVMFLSDLKYQIIPDEMQVSFILAGIIHTILVSTEMYFLQSTLSILSAGVTVMIPLLVIFLFTKGKGMGFGDVKFAFGMGVVLGMWGGLAALYISFIFGGIVGIFLLVMKKRSLKSKIPFGPFLFVGTYLMLFFSYEIIYFISRIINL